MATSKVVYSGRTLIDLTGDTVTEESLLRGYTAHKADGTLITGTAFDGYPNEFTFLDVLEDSNGHAIQDSSEDVLYGRTVYRKARNNVIFDSYSSTPYFFAIVTKCFLPSCGRCSGFRLSSSRMRLNTL